MTFRPRLRKPSSFNISGNTTYVAEGKFAGVVQLAGPGAAPHLKSGARVFGRLPAPKLITGAGTLAEYFVIPAASVALVPPSINWETAAGLASGGQTAINMLLEADLRPGTRVLLSGASGGVGTMALQLVVSTCSAAIAELFVQAVDYRANPPLTAFLAKKYDAQPFEYIHIRHHWDARIVRTLSQAGRPADQRGNYWRAHRRKYAGEDRTLPDVITRVNRGITHFHGSFWPLPVAAVRLANMVDEGRLRVVVNEALDFEDALQIQRRLVEAYDRMLARNAKGKIVKVQDV
ncbi:hypothetical protein B0H16DRAFT_1731018 [Mycena metata]|uniref:Uncharacterized protein n=1 Tax=Mycena metata TaxID=1033252 RepID=A0AAD7I7L5_9AGAR|nr:hypothetical protein B0H16DRAFT_1731018 [Mycena metata]